MRDDHSLKERAEFARSLDKEMRRLGFTIDHVAEMFSTAPGTVNAWMKGITAPPTVARRAVIRRLQNLD